MKLLGTIEERAIGDTPEGYEAWLGEIEHRLEALMSGDDPGEDRDKLHKRLVAEFGEG